MKTYQKIARAWAPVLGEQIADERARNAATLLVGVDLAGAEARRVLLRGVKFARQQCYGGVILLDATAEWLADRAQDAIKIE